MKKVMDDIEYEGLKGTWQNLVHTEGNRNVEIRDSIVKITVYK